ncbi:MAG: tetratricopeptide repeat protein, partial [Gammaproteobacteria bacterium]|nr:tetratricopeptide repeat protein [Gammaproteobacteria bacterium]
QINNKQHNKAETSFQKALKVNPKNIYALNQLGFIYRKKGEFYKAKESYEKAIDINNGYAYAHLNLGILYDLYLYDLEHALKQYKIYNKLTKDKNSQVKKWIFDLERRLKK